MNSDENVEAAQEALEASESSSGGMVPEGDEQAATGTTDAPRTLWDRLTRTDKSINLNDNTDIWDPEGKGGPNRFGAAAKQAFGIDEWPPILHMGVATAEGFYLFCIGMFDFDSPDEQDGTDDSEGATIDVE